MVMAVLQLNVKRAATHSKYNI